ncbi:MULTISPECIES: mannitol dehydrogenase family protein [unclassified Novosphingobium]|uniref:mannitol dehydrogenase family protein n=1 Tax=unclassified Novosphingobium TaxID=2644732 RepID=UPI0006B9F8F7|nr:MULTISPECIES: mannitol dehydrogenase family protein [unclassified Novosphingobium]KPF54660.1 mannitol dehydrogenase [Novosphingobium sp. AAP1]MBB3357971.1 fructuronate reductase [Novosphingobium sp. BK256]MBB3374332.1 fructuronate reductase [Novosphingobium sp. BK280]MBB3378744.1 fructuronate reductase [Novosphingobium sp. BK258]MBB3420438.1 fructuronate reductase [Novosphingobium sp. BK267]
MTRLSPETLALLPGDVARPTYDRGAMRAGVVHFGPGAFHRAHQAAAFDTLLAHDPRWGITGISLHSQGVAQALGPQGGLYTLALLDRQTRYRVIGSIGQVLTGKAPQAILGAMAHADTRIISATVTEKGYCLGADGALDTTHPAIAADLTGAGNDSWVPQSFIGWLVCGLGARRRAGLPGLTVLSCDNLTDNGRKLEAATLALAQQVDPQTAAWIVDQVCFPNAMVDSITPATDDALRAQVAAATGLEDAWPIQREGFTQWVIEDRFAGERPALDLAGVTFAADVRPFEMAKLRLLNGAHSTLAYVGLGLGHETVAQAMQDAALARFVERLMREDIAPSVMAPPGLDLSRYIADVLARFANPAIRHLLSQIAWDGSQKLPYRLLGTVREALEAGRPITRLAVPIAAWLRFLERAARSGTAITDPLAADLLARASDWRAVLAMPAVFGTLGQDAQLFDAVAKAHAALAAGQLEPV